MLADTTKKVLFISHDASRTGAPLVLLNFLKWFKVNTAIPFLVLLKIDGEMEPEFQELGPTFVWEGGVEVHIFSCDKWAICGCVRGDWSVA